LADYMAAAWKVYHGGVSSGELAIKQDLDPAVLQGWVDYLKPDGEVKPHLARWHAVQESSLAVTAKDYQDHFQASAREWQKTLAGSESQIKSAQQPGSEIPETPKFDSGKDRFFSEVCFGIVEPGTGKMFHPGPLALPEKNQEQLFTSESQVRLSALR